MAATYSFHWTISAGVITSGQGTISITVDTTGLGRQAVEASVEVGGLPEGCRLNSSCSVQLVYGCILYTDKFDYYGQISMGDEKARLDNLLMVLQQNPDLVGHIVVYAGRRSRAGLAKERAMRARNFLIENREIEPERLLRVDGGFREQLTTELYLLPRGASPPLSPTVDPSEVRLRLEVRPRRRKPRPSRGRAS